MKFVNKLQKFMYGRYGPDDLYKFLIYTYLVLFLVNIFFNNTILTTLEFLVFIIMIYRFLSKNIYARSKENQSYLKFKRLVTKPFMNLKRNVKDNDHIYKRCHKCKTTLKLPLPMKRGIKHAKCPKCGRRVTLYTWRHQKIEIIRNGERIKS